MIDTEFKPDLIVEKEGWKLNTDKAKVDDIINKINENGGRCISKVDKRLGHNQCPCCDYLEHDKCYCGLYVKQAKINKDESKKVNTTDIPYSC